MKPTKTCTIDECGNTKIMARGMCNMHYLRWYRHGDPLAGGKPRLFSMEDRFAANTERRGGCLVWTAGLSSTGYGRMTDDGGHLKVHRYAWERANGPIPEGMEVDHRCHNTLCCEVSHLRLTTHKQNAENHRGALVTSTTGIRGVWWNKQANAYQVEVKHHKKKHYGGRYKTIEEAEVAAIKLRNRLFTHNDHDRKAAA